MATRNTYIRDEMKHVLLITSIVGLTRYRVIDNNLTLDWCILLLCVLKLIFMIILSIHSFDMSVFIDFKQVPLLYLSDAAGIFNSVLSIVAISVGLLMPKHTSRVLDLISMVDQRLSHFGSIISYQKSIYIFFKWVLITVVICLIDFGIYLQRELPSYHYTDPYNVFFKICEINCGMYQAYIVTIFSILRYRYVLLNKQLHTFTETDAKIADAVVKLEDIYQLQELFIVQQNLQECCFLLNKIMGFTISVIFFNNFARMVYSLYVILIELNRIHIQGLYTNGVIHVLYWFGSMFAPLFIYIYYCQKLIEETHQSAYWLSKIKSTLYDEKMRTVVQIYSTYLYHNPVVFSASGLFILDYPLLKTMIGALTTYLVIMVQLST